MTLDAIQHPFFAGDEAPVPACSCFLHSLYFHINVTDTSYFSGNFTCIVISKL